MSADALAQLYGAHYRSLVRLAALLAGDDVIADAIASDSLVALYRSGSPLAGDRALSYLRRQVVLRARRADRYLRKPGHGAAGGSAAVAGCQRAEEIQEIQETAPGFARLPMVMALRSLRAPEREAVVLTLYLDLPEQEVAALTGQSRAALRHNLATAASVLSGQLPDEP
jgi:DNA-directed RNA polymerase specialized sigma24 family protein